MFGKNLNTRLTYRKHLSTTTTLRWYVFSIIVLRLILNCEKSVFIRSFPGPYSVWMRENTDQKNSEYGQFLRSVSLWVWIRRGVSVPLVHFEVFINIVKFIYVLEFDEHVV